jgi:transcriptional regulator with XRE-family HTH domain
MVAANMAAPSEFTRKLGIALKALNLSRARLAQRVGVDKSVASRWASGASVPAEHNLIALTQALAGLKPGFARADWDLDVEAFAAGFGMPASSAAVVDGIDAAGGLFLRSFAAFRSQIDREAPVYEGFYLTYNRSSANTGEVTRRALKLWRDRERLRFVSAGPSPLYDVEGEVFVWRSRLFFLGEMKRYDGVSLSILNGTTRPTPTYLTGIAAGLGGDGMLAPSAAVAVLEFKARFSGDAKADDKRWTDLIGMAHELSDSGGRRQCPAGDGGEAARRQGGHARP